MKLLRISPLLSAFILVLGSALLSAVSAATLIDWKGSDIVSDADLIAGPTSTGPGTLTYLFSDSTVRSPGGPAYTGLPIYGVFSLINQSGTGTPSFQDGRYSLNTYGGGSIRFGTLAEEGSGGIALRGLFYFKREDFASGVSGPITFDANSSMDFQRFGGSTIGSQRRGMMAVHALVDGDWNWYVSQARSSAGLTVSDPANELWMVYPIDGGTDPLPAVAVGTADYTTLGSEFEDIDSIGIMFDYAANEGDATFIMLESFTVNAVPEPGTVALLAGVGGLAWALMCRRRQS